MTTHVGQCHDVDNPNPGKSGMFCNAQPPSLAHGSCQGLCSWKKIPHILKLAGSQQGMRERPVWFPVRESASDSFPTPWSSQQQENGSGSKTGKWSPTHGQMGLPTENPWVPVWRVLRPIAPAGPWTWPGAPWACPPGLPFGKFGTRGFAVDAKRAGSIPGLLGRGFHSSQPAPRKGGRDVDLIYWLPGNCEKMHGLCFSFVLRKYPPLDTTPNTVADMLKISQRLLRCFLFVSRSCCCIVPSAGEEPVHGLKPNV